MGNSHAKSIEKGPLKKSVTFHLPKWKETKAEIHQIVPLSNSQWPRSTRKRLFLPYFVTPCLQHPNGIQVRDSNPELGKGRFGTVQEAEFASKDVEGCKRCSKLVKFGDQKVAVKVLKKAMIIENDAEVQIIEEIRIHSVCSGLPNVLPFLQAWQDEHHLFVAVSLCKRGSLADLYQVQKGQFSSLSILYAAQQIFKGLEAIHNLGVIYRDVKLKNVLVTSQGNLAITDFGLAKWLSKRQRTLTICGTLAFMAPEIAQGLPYDHQVDFWSLGILTYCLAFGNYPFKRGKDHEEVASILQDHHSLEFQHDDKDLQKLLKNLIDFNPEERHFEMDFEVLEKLKTFPTFFDVLNNETKID